MRRGRFGLVKLIAWLNTYTCTDTHTYTGIHLYVYIYIYVYICVYLHSVWLLHELLNGPVVVIMLFEYAGIAHVPSVRRAETLVTRK